MRHASAIPRRDNRPRQRVIPRLNPLPFTIRYAGWLGVAEGLLRFDGTAVLLEFECRDAVLGLVRSSLREARIPVGEIQEAKLYCGLFATTLAVQCSTLRATQGIPGSTHGRFRLSLDHKRRDEARRLVEQINRWETPAAG
ncbi:MAG: hypothetical protein KY476_25515 [Planctomycetes bacterium]|nr:hypothetical protein [Planctomycetota bacterium]